MYVKDLHMISMAYNVLMWKCPCDLDHSSNLDWNLEKIKANPITFSASVEIVNFPWFSYIYHTANITTDFMGLK